MLTVYAYKNCDTCRKALKWLREQAIDHEVKAIRETPPTDAEIRLALRTNGDQLRPLFNTSGGDYRDLGLKDKLPTLTESQAIDLLTRNGNLVKRPFATDGRVALTGFDPAAWGTAWG